MKSFYIEECPFWASKITNDFCFYGKTTFIGKSTKVTTMTTLKLTQLQSSHILIGEYH